MIDFNYVKWCRLGERRAASALPCRIARRVLALTPLAPLALTAAVPVRAANVSPTHLAAPRPDCPTDPTSTAAHTPQYWSSHGGYKGTVTIHPGITHTCVVPLIGGAVLRADGNTPPPNGRAIFRVVGGASGLDSPGGVNIIVSASFTKDPNGSETTPRLGAPAAITLPLNAILVRLDPATGQAIPVYTVGRVARIQMAASTVYKLLRVGAPALPQPTTPSMPATLPATGGGPANALAGLTATLLVVTHGLSRRKTIDKRAKGPMRAPATALRIGGVGALAAVALSYTYLRLHTVPSGFGAVTDANGAPPTTVGAAGEPTRIAIPRLGINTMVVRLDVAGGAWQVPSFAAGYLANGPWPGHSGNEAIAGHDDVDGGVFRRLGEVQPGDIVSVSAGGQAYRYRITALRAVSPSSIDVLKPTRAATLTLITCAPYGIDTQRLVARAVLVQ